MPISRKDVEYVARLARLRLSEEEKERLTVQLGEIVGYVEKLNELDTADVEPTAHVLPLRNITRPDEVRPCLDRDEALRLAPKAGEGFFRVPQIIE
ncbi:MAG: Asp-tRNA(Asn)/Glu-tRNA(Gln) amidotransferase subunit GatC [Candidatus Aureabacteria bacterium]|nr:Asp-tRNA(Asn)/Glu-tRNA(Gln) amidotransferase subunit GatC [Candidatus Auribacterota bacterium]NLW94652.1 Asp-tRNA(Asn)/Glu-tRNA(Gln) amidotransferase subunit GatC [Chlamydiota bacterium]HOE28222.1 Asp-tRNA(Asn)/Glu-tRNA(Gln) amidotransferase subunit GatC [bacterium]HQM53718.1 Asp-tRNA(Asn)/Glu-tRNA(Gln) amidotransferase subunit GatC [bacterium]